MDPASRNSFFAYDLKLKKREECCDENIANISALIPKLGANCIDDPEARDCYIKFFKNIINENKKMKEYIGNERKNYKTFIQMSLSCEEIEESQQKIRENHKKIEEIQQEISKNHKKIEESQQKISKNIDGINKKIVQVKITNDKAFKELMEFIEKGDQNYLKELRKEEEKLLKELKEANKRLKKSKELFKKEKENAFHKKFLIGTITVVSTGCLAILGVALFKWYKRYYGI